MEGQIYLDHAATTPVAQEVLDEMLPFFTQKFGNASSRSHAYGWETARAVELARERVARLLHGAPEEVTFTSGSTEAINLALKGVAERYRPYGNHIVTAQTEHAAVLDTCSYLEKQGFRVTYLPPDTTGAVAPQQLENALTDKTILCALMWANNETGVCNDMDAIGAVCARHEVLLFSDATQAVGKIPVDPTACGVHLLACSAHKFYGPKGVGALWTSHGERRVALGAQLHGGGHEQGQRSGTLNVPGIVGMGAAAALALKEMDDNTTRLTALRNRLENGLLRELDAVLINGAEAKHRLPNISSVTLRFVEAEALLSSFQRRLAISTGSACASAALAPSSVLLAMGLDREAAKSTVRISLGRDTTAQDIDTAVRLLVEGARKLRSESPAWELFQDGIIV